MCATATKSATKTETKTKTKTKKASKAKVEANRRNAQRAWGPRLCRREGPVAGITRLQARHDGQDRVAPG